MKLYVKDKTHDVPLHTKLTPNLYSIITPLLYDLVQTKGAQSSIEQDIMQKVFASQQLSIKIDVTKGQDALKDIMHEPEFQDIIKHAYLKARTHLFDVILIDDETIPKIFAFAKACIDINKLKDASLIAGLQSDYDSDFWKEQDIEGMLTDLEFFRSTVCRRIRIM